MNEKEIVAAAITSAIFSAKTNLYDFGNDKPNSVPELEWQQKTEHSKELFAEEFIDEYKFIRGFIARFTLD